MIQGCEIVNPKPPEAEKVALPDTSCCAVTDGGLQDPAQEAARARRKAEYEEIQYQKMVSRSPAWWTISVLRLVPGARTWYPNA